MVNSGLKEAAIGVVGDGIKQAVESEAETASVNALANNPAELLNTVSSGSETEETVYSYDANGNQITKTTSEKTETYTYDGLNQLIGFADGDIAASYAYNVSGLRIEKTVDGETINHVWDGSQQIIADVVDNDFYEADCYLRGTNLVAKYNYCNGVKSEYTYYTQNAHGDVVNLTDETGAVTKSYTYDAFGVEQNIDDSDTNAFRYCGEYFDAETGTVYLRARYYDPSIGRFISRDSYAGKNEDPLSLNRYTYCHNNSIYYNDKSGNAVETVVDVAGLAYDSYEFAKDPSLVNGLFWVWSAASIIIPFIPGSYVARGVSTGTKLISGAGDIYQTANRLENASTVAETVVSTAKASENVIDSANDIKTVLSSEELVEIVNGSTNTLSSGRTMMNPQSINFSQATVSSNVNKYTQDMINGNWTWNDDNIIRIINHNDQLVLLMAILLQAMRIT